MVKDLKNVLLQNYVSYQQSQESDVFRFLDVICNKTDREQ
jgi:hypothetical protein